MILTKNVNIGLKLEIVEMKYRCIDMVGIRVYVFVYPRQGPEKMASVDEKKKNIMSTTFKEFKVGKKILCTYALMFDL